MNPGGSETERRHDAETNHTNAAISTSMRAGNERHSIGIASDGTLTGGSVISNAAAGPTPTPSASIACTIGTSPAVGITNSIPAMAKATIHSAALPTSGATYGNSHARAAPSSSTSTMYSGISRSVMRASSFIQRTNGLPSAVWPAAIRASAASSTGFASAEAIRFSQ